MNKTSNNITDVNNIYLNLVELLKGKIATTKGELQHILRSIKYILKKEEIKYNEAETEFIENCNQIINGLNGLEGKLKDAYADLMVIGVQLKKYSNDTLKNNNFHLEIILQLDCIQSRTLAFAEKLEYLNRAYENLIAPYNSQYLPMPSITKRIKTSSLMLYFNKNLNITAQNLQKYFFKIDDTKIENNKQHRVFTTWEFSSNDHLKSIDDEKQTFAALSFWFYEKQILYPIAFHEITHSIYMRKAFHNDIKDIKLSEKEKEKIVSELLIKTNKDIVNSMIYTVYQDIVSDFCAYSVAGASYIFSLFFTGFMRGIHLNFYKDLTIESQKNQKNIDNEDKKCLSRHNNLTLLNWDFDSDNTDNNLMSIYIRIMLLVKLHIRQNNGSENYIFKNELIAIVDILNFIYPNDYYFKDLVGFNNKKEFPTFDDIMRIHEGRYNQYNFVKNFTQLFLNLIDTVVFENKKIDLRVKNYIDKVDEINNFKNNAIFKTIIDRNSETKYLSGSYNSFMSEYDLFWKKRFYDINFNKSKDEYKSKYLGRLLRLHNLSKILGKELNKDIELKDIIYELVFFKFQTKEHIFLDFINNGNLSKKIQESFKNTSKISYAFGPFDISILTKNTSKSVDRYLNTLLHSKLFTKLQYKEIKFSNYLIKLTLKDYQYHYDLLQTIDFFTERHALLLLKKIDGKLKEKAKNNYFDVSISIDMQGEFQKEDINEDCSKKEKELITPRCKFKKLKNLLDDITNDQCNTEKLSFDNIKIFASLGNENYVVYIDSINLNSFNTIMNKLLELEVIKNINTTILLNNKIDTDKLKSLEIKNREVVLLCKLNKDHTYSESIVKINTKLNKIDENIRVFKKYGIFDIVIIPKQNTYLDIYRIIDELKNNLSDVQMELQLKP